MEYGTMVGYGNIDPMEDAGMRSYARLQAASKERASYMVAGKGYAERAHTIPLPLKPNELPIDSRTTDLYGKGTKVEDEMKARNQRIYDQLYNGTYSMN